MQDTTPELLALQAAIVGRYSLVRELGRGGMGIVFLARDIALDRPVAIKLLASVQGGGVATRERFLREARTAARLSHPNIVPVHAVEEKDGHVFFVMAYVDGETLAERVSRDGPLDPATLHRITREVAWALGHAHAQGVVHRDVKPENILIERATGRAMVADFGIARMHADAAQADLADTTSRGGIVGTPRYMSPEQLGGDQIDGRSDIYSLGLVMTYAATGLAPPTVMQRMQGYKAIILSDSPAAVLAPIAERCTHAVPEDRFESAEALLTALDVAPTPPAIRPSASAFLSLARGKTTEVTTALAAVATCLLMAGLLDFGTGKDDFMARLVNQVLYAGMAMGAAAYSLINFGSFLLAARNALKVGETPESLGRAALSLPYDAGGVNERHGPDWGRFGRNALIAIAVWTVAVVLFARNIAVIPAFCAILAAPVVMIRSLARMAATLPNRTRPLGWLTRIALKLGATGLKLAPRDAAAEPTVAGTAFFAKELFAALPAAQKSALGDVNGLVERLERAAIELRRPGLPADRRRADVDTALESIKLDLMKLHAEGADSISIGADLESAMRLGEEVLRQVEAKREVNRLLRTGDTPA